MSEMDRKTAVNWMTRSFNSPEKARDIRRHGSVAEAGLGLLLDVIFFDQIFEIQLLLDHIVVL